MIEERVAPIVYEENKFDKHGIFILDQSRVVVPDNENYQDAVRMPRRLLHYMN